MFGFGKRPNILISSTRSAWPIPNVYVYVYVYVCVYVYVSFLLHVLLLTYLFVIEEKAALDNEPSKAS